MERASPRPLHGWIVLSLRPHGGHGGLRAAARRAGAGCMALSPLRIALHDDAESARALAATLACQRIIATSPNAVRLAAARVALPATREWIAVGDGTARALRRAGITHIHVPGRADSEGVLALAVLQEVAGGAIGLLTGSGGRGVIANTLIERGARLQRADVYARQPIAIPASAWRRLRGQVDAGQRLLLPLTSGEAWALFEPQLPDALRDDLRRARVVVPSQRLEAAARQAGFTDVVRAAGPHPAQLLGAALPVQSTHD